MFLGEFEHALDDKGRLTIPAKLRAGFAAGAVVTRGFEPCLVVYPVETFRLLEQKAHGLTPTDPSHRAIFRLLFGGAADVVLDSVGRVLIPPYLRTYAALATQVVVVGAGQYIEVWDAGKWSEQLATLNDAESNSRRFVSLDLATGGIP
ncbi:MAG: division/cell wall cluster transcriptional repressor MraZ [Anaerolineales bacterium]